MKEFDIELAKKYKVISTRDGCKARIVDFNVKRLDGRIILAIVDTGEEEIPLLYREDGSYMDGICACDLVTNIITPELLDRYFQRDCTNSSNEHYIYYILDLSNVKTAIRNEWNLIYDKSNRTLHIEDDPLIHIRTIDELNALFKLIHYPLHIQ